MNKIFGNEGCLSDILSFFEHRKQQEEMADHVYSIIKEGKNGIIEAGTGTGKTLAYLIPALKHAMDTSEVLAVSTATKNLQTQLIKKDVPLAEAIFSNVFSTSFKTSLCLGSWNYICLDNYETAKKKGRLTKNDIETFDTIDRMLTDKRLFTRYDISVPSYLWDTIGRNPDKCVYGKCRFFNICQFQKARRKWHKSNLLVMNHSLFFANIAMNKAYLPEFRYAIFDEAHSLPQIISDQMGFEIHSRTFKDITNFIFLENRDVIKKIYKRKEITSLKKLFTDTAVAIEELFVILSNYLNGQQNLRLKKPIAGQEKIKSLLEQIIFDLKSKTGDQEEGFPSLEMEMIRQKVYVLQQNLNMAISISERKWVFWAGRENSKKGDVFLKGQPVDISEIVRKEVNSHYESVLYISATLTVEKSFGYFEKELGIDSAEHVLLDSPYDYFKNTIMYVPDNFPEPSDKSYPLRSADVTSELCEMTNGNVLVLFTSYSMLEAFKKQISAISDRKIFFQEGNDSVTALKNYIENPGSILLGTHSYWQGLDLQGGQVKAIVLARLPFNVPDDPYIQEKSELAENEGKNPFETVQIPPAIIRFKQGYGRLIRSGSDRGIIAVLDNRIIKKNYGKKFLGSIPRCRISSSLEEVKDFALKADLFSF